MLGPGTALVTKLLTRDKARQQWCLFEQCRVGWRLAQRKSANKKPNRFSLGGEKWSWSIEFGPTEIRSDGVQWRQAASEKGPGERVRRDGLGRLVRTRWFKAGF